MYMYGMRTRPFDIGCQPMNGFIKCDEGRNINGYDYWNILEYDRKLTSNECDTYSLDYIDPGHRECYNPEDYINALVIATEYDMDTGNIDISQAVIDMNNVINFAKKHAPALQELLNRLVEYNDAVL